MPFVAPGPPDVLDHHWNMNQLIMNWSTHTQPRC